MVRKYKPTAILEKLASDDPEVAEEGKDELEAAIAEEEIDDRELKDALKDKRRPVRAAVARVLHEADAENLDALLVLTRDGNDEERKLAFWDLESKGRNPRVLAALVVGRDDPNQEVREAALQGLREVSTFELDVAKPEELVSKSKFGGAPDGLAPEDHPEGARFVAQFTREDVGLKKFAMAFFFVQEGKGTLVLGGGGPRSKPRKDDVVYSVSLGEGANVLTPLLPTWLKGPAVPKCSACSKEMRFLAELSSFEDMVVFAPGKSGAYYLFACPDECRTVSTEVVFQEK
ncbi:HEAT repeat domain-containing protein [bacterium]|nr:HEAT repeat domain-containing protein [bacterium]